MRRGDYLALAWAPDDAGARQRADLLGRRLAAETGWSRALGTGALDLWTRGAPPPPVQMLPRAAGVLIGDLHARPGCPFGDGVSTEGRSPEALAQRLCRSGWGGYVALLQGRGAPQAFRDPSGAWDCLTWDLEDGLCMAASDLASTPGWLRPRRLALDWDAIAAFVAAPTLACHAPLFSGVRTVIPGDLATLGSQGTSTAIWRPAQFAGAVGGTDLAEVSRELVRRVDEATAALVGRHAGVLVELSGGLDSSIVAGALGAVGLEGRVRQWVNRYGDRPEGDERAHARAVAERLGADLTELAKPFSTILHRDFEELAASAWPALNGTDAPRDRDMAERLAATGAGAIVSGQGGDAVFLQAPSALVAADLVRRRGLAAAGSPVLADIARRNRISAWSVLAQVNRARKVCGLPAMTTSLLPPGLAEVAARLTHPWDPPPGAVDAGKALQIRALANTHLDYGDCRRRRMGDLIHPLLAQPVVELCLVVPTSDLAGAAFDRPFARAAFAARIPERVRARRYKGTLTSYFARWVAGSLDILRPWLLEGCLCAAGVLDRARVERALDPARMILEPEPADILNAAMAEAWVRHWQGRVPDLASAARRR